MARDPFPKTDKRRGGGLTVKHRKKISRSLTGRRLSESHKESLRQARRVIKKFSAAEEDLILRRHQREGLSYRELARQHGVSKTTIERAIRAARRRAAPARQ